MSASSTLSLPLSPFLVTTASSHTCRSFGPSPNPLLMLFLVLFACGPCVILLVPSLRNCCFFQSVPYRFTFIVLPLSLLVRGLFLSLLALLLILFPRMPSVSFFIALSWSLSLLLPLFLLLLLRVLIAFGVWLLPPLFLVMFLFPLFLKPRLGVPLLSLLPSICVMYSFLPVWVFRWVQWLLRVLWFDVLVRLSCSFSFQMEAGALLTFASLRFFVCAAVPQ